MKDKRIHYDSVVVDGHNDTMMKIIDEETWLPKVDIGKPTDFHIDIPKLIEGGLNVAFFASFTQGYYGNDCKSLSRSLALINALYFTAKNNPDTFQISKTVKEINQAVKDNKIAAVATIEGAYGINEKNYLELLRQYHDLGIRVIAPTWNYSNHIGEGASKTYGDAGKTPSYGGLTKLGEKVIEEMNELEILVDVSHLAEETFWDVINITKSPIIASHSGVYNLKNHPRNLKDDQLKAIKENGGLVAVVLFPNFLSDKREVYVRDFVDHIDYIVNLIGVEHVGIGSDFDGAKMPVDLKDSSQIYRITDELINRGYDEWDIKKILGKNILRLLDQADTKVIYNRSNIKCDIQFAEEKIMLTINKDKDINWANSKLVIDGIAYEASIDNKNLSIFYQIDKSLNEKFHVLTLEIDNDDNIERFTKIILGDNLKTRNNYLL